MNPFESVLENVDSSGIRSSHAVDPSSFRVNRESEALAKKNVELRQEYEKLQFESNSRLQDLQNKMDHVKRARNRLAVGSSKTSDPKLLLRTHSCNDDVNGHSPPPLSIRFTSSLSSSQPRLPTTSESPIFERFMICGADATISSTSSHALQPSEVWEALDNNSCSISEDKLDIMKDFALPSGLLLEIVPRESTACFSGPHLDQISFVQFIDETSAPGSKKSIYGIFQTITESLSEVNDSMLIDLLKRNRRMNASKLIQKFVNGARERRSLSKHATVTSSSSSSSFVSLDDDDDDELGSNIKRESITSSPGIKSRLLSRVRKLWFNSSSSNHHHQDSHSELARESSLPSLELQSSLAIEKKEFRGVVITQRSFGFITRDEKQFLCLLPALQDICDNERRHVDDQTQAIDDFDEVDMSGLSLSRGRRQAYLSQLLNQYSNIPSLDWTVSDWSLAFLLSLFPASIILKLFHLLLVEKNLVIVGNDCGVVSLVCRGILSLLSPFTWEGTYLSLLPDHLAELLLSPVPYIIGIHSAYSIPACIANRMSPSSSYEPINVVLQQDYDYIEQNTAVLVVDVHERRLLMPSSLPRFPLTVDIGGQIDRYREIMLSDLWNGDCGVGDSTTPVKNEVRRSSSSSSVNGTNTTTNSKSIVSVTCQSKNVSHTIDSYHCLPLRYPLIIIKHLSSPPSSSVASSLTNIRELMKIHASSLCGDLLVSGNAWRKYGAYDGTSKQFDFFPIWFIEPLQAKLEYQSIMIQTQAFSSLVQRLATDDESASCAVSGSGMP